MKQALITAALFLVLMVVVITRTTEDFGEAQARMSTSEVRYLETTLSRIRPNMSQRQLVELLGKPRVVTPWGSEWNAPVFPGRIRVYIDEKSKRIEAVAWRKLGWFDVRFKPWDSP